MKGWLATDERVLARLDRDDDNHDGDGVKIVQRRGLYATCDRHPITSFVFRLGPNPSIHALITSNRGCLHDLKNMRDC